MTDVPTLSAQEMAENIQKQGGLVAPFILQGTDPNGHPLQFIFSGLTLRQHYAGLAMAALIHIWDIERPLDTGVIANAALDVADAMLEVQK